MKRSQPKREWRKAREKIQREGGCRLAYRLERYCAGPIQAAHIIGRSHDAFTLDGEARQTETWMVEPDRVIPLCEAHHRWYDSHEQDILQALQPREQVQAVRDAGGLENARIRTAPSAYKRTEAA